MPETITSYTTFVTKTTISSSEMNTNFSNYRGTYLPIDLTAASAVDQTFDVGNSDYRFKRTYGNPVVNVNSVTTAYTATITDYTILGNASAGAFAITLFAANVNTGATLHIKKEGTDTNTLTLTPNGAETIDGTTTATLNRTNDNIIIRSDGANWFKEGGFALSLVRVNTSSGAGSTDTKIREYTNTIDNYGDDITYSSNSVNGSTWTINKSGVYALHLHDGQNTAPSAAGWTVDSASLTTSIFSVAQTEVLASFLTQNTGDIGSADWVGFLSAGAVLRVHLGTNTNDLSLATRAGATVSRVA